MSKSYKKEPVVSNTKAGARAGAQHSWKKSGSRHGRRDVKQIVNAVNGLNGEELEEYLDDFADEETLDLVKTGSIYSSPSDGRHRLKRWDDESETEYKERVRKETKK